MGRTVCRPSTRLAIYLDSPGAHVDPLVPIRGGELFGVFQTYLLSGMSGLENPFLAFLVVAA